MEQLKQKIRELETGEIVQAIKNYGLGILPQEADRLLRACLLDVYEERLGEEAVIKLEEQLEEQCN